ncbi:MAG TPA: TIGR04076 family protein [Anaerolineaceae bacterium]|nr:TIGR04076 family protein [Anaerolineaceae bacterium]HPN53060.1 TIGR04076 family protein [Anaerolineaceae bacterium]
MPQCKITVIKTSFNKELVDLYVEAERKKTLGPCEVFHEGQEFITDVMVGGMPQGFCPWAWDDIFKVLTAFYANGKFDMWTQGGEVIIACCTDGTRPVYFKIEKI